MRSQFQEIMREVLHVVIHRLQLLDQALTASLTHTHSFCDDLESLRSIHYYVVLVNQSRSRVQQGAGSDPPPVVGQHRLYDYVHYTALRLQILVLLSYFPVRSGGGRVLAVVLQ